MLQRRNVYRPKVLHKYAFPPRTVETRKMAQWSRRQCFMRILRIFTIKASC